MLSNEYSEGNTDKIPTNNKRLIDLALALLAPGILLSGWIGMVDLLVMLSVMMTPAGNTFLKVLRSFVTDGREVVACSLLLGFQMAVAFIQGFLTGVIFRSSAVAIAEKINPREYALSLGAYCFSTCVLIMLFILTGENGKLTRMHVNVISFGFSIIYLLNACACGMLLGFGSKFAAKAGYTFLIPLCSTAISFIICKIYIMSSLKIKNDSFSKGNQLNTVDENDSRRLALSEQENAL